MKVYMIVAYPNQNGLSYAAFERARQGFQDAGHEIRIADLYEDQFNPVLFFDETHRRHDLQFDEETRVYRENITWADHLVFVFPIWWGGMPAMLKGFIDRVFAKGFAYHYQEILPIGRLKDKTAWIIDTNDTPYWYVKLFYQDYGKVLQHQVLAFCGIKTLRHTSMYFTRKSSLEKRTKWLEKISDIARRQLRSE